MSTRALMGRFRNDGWVASWHLFDSAPSVLGARLLRSVDARPGALRRLADSMVSKPCWREWPVEPEEGLEEFRDLVTPATVVWAFDWAYLVSEAANRIELHTVETLQAGRPPIDSVDVPPGRPPRRHTFRVPTPKGGNALVRRARTLEELRDVLAGTPPDFASRMLTRAEISPALKLTRAERDALPDVTRVTYVARKDGRCVRELPNPDGTWRYVIEDFPPRR